LSEAEDGFDTLTWLQRQPWCNGRIGMDQKGDHRQEALDQA